MSEFSGDSVALVTGMYRTSHNSRSTLRAVLNLRNSSVKENSLYDKYICQESQ